MNFLRRAFRKEKKLIVIGLDGVPHSLLEKLAMEGVLPRVKELLRLGVFIKTRSTLPPVSSVCWTTFTTGCNPGRHGIFGFIDKKPSTYRVYIPNSHSIGCPTILEMLSSENKKVLSIAVPVSYPPKKVNGAMVGCFLTPDIRKGTYPVELGEVLADMGYKLDVDSWKARKDIDSLYPDIITTFQKRVEVFYYLFKRFDPDYAILHIMETDRLHHFLFEYFERKDEKFYPLFLDVYRKIDAFLSNLYETYGEDHIIMLISDHGFCSLKREVYINHFLKEEGLLQYAIAKPETISDIKPEKTYAFSLDPGRIYLNVKGREPEGIVEFGREYNEMRERLKRFFLDLKEPESGEKVIREVFMREEIYRGEALPIAPDMILVPERGYDLKGAVQQNFFFRKGILTGMHTHDDSFIYLNQPIKKAMDGQLKNIEDATATIYSLMKVKPALEMDGVSLFS